jgi:uncharacterized protein (TIGR03083 family)
MGMNGDSPMAPVSREDLATYAIDAHDPEHADGIAAHLDASPDAVHLERDLRSAAGEFAAAVVHDVTPAAALRSRVLEQARLRRRPAAVVAGSSPIDVHRVELARAIVLLRDLTVEDWGRPVDPPEMAGWTVHDVVVHLAANESLLAHQLGVPVTGIPETATDNEGRTAHARTRHAGCPPAYAVAELEAAAEAADTAIAVRGETRLDEAIDWWGGRAAARVAVLVRAFETWTHADDIRRAVGTAMVVPPPGSLHTLAHTACGFVPSMLAARGVHHPDRLVRFRFTDLDGPCGGAAWDVDLGTVGGVRPAGDGAVDAEIVTEAAAACRAMSARLDPRLLAWDVVGDAALAGEVRDALPALAVL